MTRYMVGTNTAGKSSTVTVEAEDALIAALKVKQKHPDAAITYVRKHNVRGDKRHPHRDVAKGVVYMASLSLEANVQFMTVMATKMPYIGRG